MRFGHSRRVVIDGAYGHRNLGDELILRGLLTLIGESPERVSVMTADPVDTSRRHRTHTLRRESRYRRAGTCRTSPQTLLRAVAAVASADTYIVGGGALITDERGLLPLVRLVALSSVARVTRVPMLVLGVSVGPLETAAGRRLARRLLSQADVILTRDHKSHARAVDLVGAERVRACPDVAFLAAFPADGGGLESRGRSVAVAIRDLPPSRGFTDRDAQRASMVANLARLLDVFVERHDAEVVFVPFQTLPPSGTEKRLDDVALSRAVIAAMTNAARASVVQITDELALRDALSGYRVVLAQRFHAGVVALAAGTPLVTLGYHDKFAGLEARSVGGVASTRDVIAGDITPTLAALVSAWESGDSTAPTEGRARTRAARASAAGVRALLTAIRPCDAAANAPPRTPPSARP
jgi:polysaccharide pyruvyl transferase WcaK-like protein